MSIEELQNLNDDYDNIYFGKSDKDFDKLELQNLIEALMTFTTKMNELEAKVTTLEEQMANRMLCTKYKTD